MARKWIYLNEEDINTLANKKSNPNEETVEGKDEEISSLQNDRKKYMSRAKMHAKNAVKNAKLATQAKMDELKAAKEKKKVAAAASTTNAQDTANNESFSSLLDEDEDASPINGKSNKETKRDLGEDDIINEKDKEPLQEFVSLIKFLKNQ